MFFFVTWGRLRACASALILQDFLQTVIVLFISIDSMLHYSYACLMLIIACCRVSIKKKIPFRGQYCLGSMSVSQIYWGSWVYLCQSNMLDFVGVCPSV